MVIQLKVLTKKASSEGSSQNNEAYKTYLTKDLEPEALQKNLTFEACLKHLLDAESAQSYKNAFSSTLLVKCKKEATFKELTDDTKPQDVIEVGLLATKRRVLKEILKEVKKSASTDAKVDSAVEVSSSSRANSQPTATEESGQKRTGAEV